MKIVESSRVMSPLYEIGWIIDIDRFLKSILTGDKYKGDDYLYFEMVIKCLLDIIIVKENYFDSFTIFNNDFETIQKENCNIVQMCSILINHLRSRKTDTKGDKTHLLDFCKSFASTGLAGQLQTSESLRDLCIYSKLNLCETLIDCIALDLKGFKDHFIQIKAKISQVCSRLAFLKRKTHEIEMETGVFDVEGSKSNCEVNSENSEIEALKKELGVCKEELKNVSRAQEPLGRIETTKKDSEIVQFLYFWHFKSLPNCLVVEKRVSNVDIGILFNSYKYYSECHLIDNLDTLRFAFNFSSTNSNNSTLANTILKIERNIDDLKSESAFDKFSSSKIISNNKNSFGSNKKINKELVNNEILSGFKDLSIIKFRENSGIHSIEREITKRYFKDKNELMRQMALNKLKLDCVKVI